MATIRAFKAIRPLPELIEKIPALPYDVMNTEEARKCVEGNPYSFLHIDKPEIHFDHPEDDDIYIFAGKTLAKMREEGAFVQDEKSLYIYGLNNGLTVQYGLVCLVSATEYDQGLIKKHENTRTDKEQDRIKHVTYCKAHTGPIFLAYKDMDDFTSWMMDYVQTHQPLYHLTCDDGVTHEVYQVDQASQIAKITTSFEKANALYIADGHHRAAAAAAVARNYREAGKQNEDSEHFLAVIFPKEQLCIMDYNRVLKDESSLNKEELFRYIQEKFDLEAVSSDLYKPDKRHTFGMRYQGKWYKLTIKPDLVEEDDPVACLDASLLQKHLLEPLFGIENPKEDKRIDFVGGIRGIEELNRRCEADNGSIAFSMYPTSMDELINVADANQLMPPKSTWFEPKLRSGLFIHAIENENCKRL